MSNKKSCPIMFIMIAFTDYRFVISLGYNGVAVMSLR